MARKLVRDKDKKKYKKAIQQLVRDLSEPLTVVQESPLFVDCPNCIWDSVNKKSSNIFDVTFVSNSTIFVGTDQVRTISPTSFTEGRCPVCIGEGQLFTTKEVCIPAMVNYVSSTGGGGTSSYMDLPAGREGVNFMIVKTQSCHYNLLTNNSIFTVKGGVKCEKFRPPFVRGLGGEDAICEMILQTTEAGERSTNKAGLDKLSRDEDPRRRIKGPSDINILRGRHTGRNS